jgi:hypothetical protein
MEIQGMFKQNTCNLSQWIFISKDNLKIRSPLKTNLAEEQNNISFSLLVDRIQECFGEKLCNILK